MLVSQEKAKQKPSLACGDNRNLVAAYKYWSDDAIRADLDSKRHPFSVLCLNIHQDLNLSTCLRGFNAFLGTSFYITGKKHWDRRGAVGVHNYTRVKFIEGDELEELLNSSNLVGVDNISGAESIDDFVWPSNPLMIFGEECGGIGDFAARCQKKVYIPQYGSVRSLNVGVASGIVMNDWCRKNAKGRIN